MPLSEHEERILAEIERQLAAEDPRFVARGRRTWGSGLAARLRGRGARLGATNQLHVAIVLGVLGVIGVLGLTFEVAFGVVGMVLLVAAVLLAAHALTRRGAGPGQSVDQPPDGTDERG